MGEMGVFSTIQRGQKGGWEKIRCRKMDKRRSTRGIGGGMG
jgi:hypothetical protein